MPHTQTSTHCLTRKLLTTLLFSVCLTGTVKAAPVCTLSDSDIDNDGWGWENNQSCVYATGSATSTATATTDKDFPACTSTIDDNNDGWGWENNRSCIHTSSSSSNTASEQGTSTAVTDSGFPVCTSSTDDNSDGWGWENNQSCVFSDNTTTPAATTSTPTEAGFPVCTASSDDNNDGWGWENNQSCVFSAGSTAPVATASNTPTSTGTPVCTSSTDDNNDGWGWENNQSCVFSSTDTTAPETSPSNTSPGVAVCQSSSSDDNNDGWGWENNRSCMVTASTASETNTAPSSPATSPARKVMAVGDSITHGVSGQTSYRKPLNTKLIQASCDFEFVGSQTSNFGHNTFTAPHEGYTSQTADEFLTGATNHAGTNDGIAVSMQTYKPDVVLLHIGTNDMRLGQNIDNTVAEIDQIISIIHQNKSSTVVLVANVIPWYLAAESAVQTLGTKIEAYVAQLADPRVVLVDVRAGYTRNMMISDQAHPNATGDAHIATAFFKEYNNAGLCN